MHQEQEDTLYRMRFDSVNEIAGFVESVAEECNLDDFITGQGKGWAGVSSFPQALKLARSGWAAELDRTLEVAESAVDKVERDHEMLSFVATHDVAGCEVDVARYLDGTPENMIDYPLTPIVKAGRVITLCASISFSAAIRPASIIQRGQTVAALALALGRLGYSTEVWTDWTTEGHSGGLRAQVRTLVKGAQDALDAERLIYALAHPSMLRIFSFAATRKMPARWSKPLWGSLGMPVQQPIEDLPEGTLYLPGIRSGYDVPDADEQLERWLRELGIITD